MQITRTNERAATRLALAGRFDEFATADAEKEFLAVVQSGAKRIVLDLAGVTDVVSKIHTRTKNKLTIARATVEALKALSVEKA